MDKIVIASSTTSQRTSAENICQDGRTKLPSRGFPNATPIRVLARTEVFSGKRFSEEELKHAERERHTIRVRVQKRKFLGTSIATLDD
jgi:hypothetical protein